LSLFKAKHWILSVLIIALSQWGVSASANTETFGKRIFAIQKKMALRGSTLSEYKLGTFYEFGVSVKPDEKEAAVWYTKAAKKDNKAAADRLIYLDIKQQGYNLLRHSKWIDGIKAQAKQNNVHSIIILGQLTRFGFGVDKDLQRALDLLQQASSLNHNEVDAKIKAIKNEIAAMNAKQEKAEKAVEKESNKTKAKEKTNKKKNVSPVNKAKAKPVTKPKPSAAEIKAAKRLKYEAAMRKLKEENDLLNKEQEWTEESSD